MKGMIVPQYFRRWLDRLPYGGVFDRIYFFIIFLYAHRRLPRRNSALLNDYLYFLKATPDIMDIFRQVTSDKVMVKDYVRNACGQELVLETFAVFETVDEIDMAVLPKPCVIKPAHGSGSVVFVQKSQEALSADEKKKLDTALRVSPYDQAREGNYRYLRRRLICEQMLSFGQDTKDYKFFCYKGQPRIIQVDSARHSDHKRNLYDEDWRPLNIRYNFPLGEWEVAPEGLERMKEVARVLSAPFEFVRVDFFVYGGGFYVGELTHCPESAHGRFIDPGSERTFSEILFDGRLQT